MKKILRNRKGAVLIIFAILLIVLIGFVALAVDVGRWYTVRAELSKAVDAGAFAGAKNISNRHLDEYYSAPNEGHLRFAEDIAHQNFFSGYLMTTDKPTFTATELPEHRIQVEGSVKSPPNLTSLFAADLIPTASSGIAKKNEVEIMLVLDRSGSMGRPNSKIADLKTAARSFVDYFKDTQDKDKMGLISFATTARVDVNLGNNYVSTMNTLINNMDAKGATNAEDALIRSIGTGGFSDQTGVPGDKRVQQFAIFFSDGMPTALRDLFKYNNNTQNNNQDYDGVVYAGPSNCRTWEYSSMSISTCLMKPNATGSDCSSNQSNYYLNVNPSKTGDGKDQATTNCNRRCVRTDRWGTCTEWRGDLNTKWYLFESSLGTVPRYTAEACSIPGSALVPYFCTAARQLALNNAQTLKNRFIKIYVIGLGSNQDIDRAYLRSLSSGDNFTFIAPTSGELKAIFNTIAKDIKLRLVQ